MRYKQDKVWLWLRRNPGQPVRKIAEGIKHEQKTLSHILRAMQRNGTARRGGGMTHASVWYATDKRPSCQAGLHVNSLANMDKTRAERRELLRLANIARGYDPDAMGRKVVVPKDKCTLAQVWKLTPAQNDSGVRDNHRAGGTNTPVRNAEAA